VWIRLSNVDAVGSQVRYVYMIIETSVIEVNISDVIFCQKWTSAAVLSDRSKKRFGADKMIQRKVARKEFILLYLCTTHGYETGQEETRYSEKKQEAARRLRYVTLHEEIQRQKISQQKSLITPKAR